MSILIDCDIARLNGSAKGRVTARDGDQLIHEDRIDLTSATSRKRFAVGVAKRLIGADAQDAKKQVEAATVEVDTLLLAKLTQLRGSAKAPPDDLDVSRIVRPDLFITSDVVGLSVPTFSIIDGRPAGRWRLYLRWADGKREVRDLANSIDLPGGTRLWLHPEPTLPPADLLPGWTAKARQAWLSGLAAPDPADLFKRLCEVIADYVDLPADDAAGVRATVALWIMLTYVFQAWDAVPYLYGGGPAGSGKTRLFIEIPARLARNPVESSNISASALFRRLHDRGGTLLLDEAERLKEGTPEAAELRSILLAGYKRGGKATRNEPLGDGRFKQIEFDVFGPKAIVCVNGLPATLASRCIPTIMFRSPPGSETPRRRLDENPRRWADLRDDLHALALEYGGVLQDVARRSDVCPPMSGRNYELWQPLMALAWWIEQHGVNGLLELVQEYAQRVIGNSQEDQTPDADETFLELLADAVKEDRTPAPGELLAKAREADAETFRKWTARGVSNTLKRYGLVTCKNNGRRCYSKVTVDDLARIQRSYGIDLGCGDTP